MLGSVLLVSVLSINPVALAQDPDPIDPTIPPDSQRIRILEEGGGPITTALPLADGTALVAEGGALLRVNIAGQSIPVSERQELGYGTLVDLAAINSTQAIALTEAGVLSLEIIPGQDIPTIVDFQPGGGQSLDVQGGIIAVAARSAGVRLLQIDVAGNLSPLETVALSGEAADVALDPAGGQLFVAVSEAGVYPIQLETGTVGQPIAGIEGAQSVAFAGSLLTVASAERVYTIDVQRQSIVGTYAPLSDGRRMVIEDEYAYIADAAHGLKILWLTAFDRPVQTFGEVNRSLTALTVADGFVYAAGENTFRIYDARNRFRPLTLSSIPLSHTATDIAIGGGRAYVALGEGGVAIIDINNLSQPQQIKRIPLAGPAEGILFYEDRVYATSSDGTLTVISAGPIGQETISATMALPSGGYDIGRRGDFLYVAAGELGLVAVNIIFPTEPTIAGTLAAETNTRYTSMTIEGKRAYVSDGEGYLVADVSFPANMGRLARIDSPSQHTGVSGITLYSVSGQFVDIYDIRATAEPVFIRQYAGIQQISHLNTQGDFIFLSNADSGPDGIILSLETPDAPFETDNFGASGGTLQLIPRNRSLLISQGLRGLALADLTDTGSTSLRASYQPQDAFDVVVQQNPDFTIRRIARFGEVSAAALGSQGLLIQNSDSALIQVQASDEVNDIAIDSRYIYAAQDDGLTIYDPAFGVPLVQVPLPAPANGLDITREQVYLALQDGSVAIVDIGDPTNSLQPLSGISTATAASFARVETGGIFALTGDTIRRVGVFNPNRITLSNQERLAASADGLRVDGGVLYVFSEGSSVRSYLASQIGGNALERDRFFLGTAEQPGLFAPDEFPPGVDLAVTDGVAFIAYGVDGLSRYSIGEPGNSQRLSDRSTHALTISGERLFSAGASLAAWDVSTPASPLALASVPLAASGRSVTYIPDPLEDDTGLLIVTSAQGIRLFEWDDNAFRAIGELNTHSPVDQAVQIGERAYLVLADGGVAVVDLANPTEPTLLFTIVSQYGQFANDLLPIDERTLLISWEGGIEAYQTSQAGNVPQLVDVIASIEEEAVAIAVDGEQEQIALGLANNQVALIRTSAGSQSVEFAATPGNVEQIGLQQNIVYVADGVCGLRVFDAGQAGGLGEVGYWQSGFASDVRPLPEGGASLQIGNRSLTVLYDPLLSSKAPPLPQAPEPGSGMFEVELTPQLTWNVADPRCDNYTYQVNFGTDPQPPLYAEFAGEPELGVGPLRPGTTYYWQVSVMDRQGDMVQGDIWRFETQTSRLPSPLPPSPPPFLQRLIENPVIPISLAGLFIACVVGAYIYLRRRRQKMY